MFQENDGFQAEVDSLTEDISRLDTKTAEVGTSITPSGPV